MREDGGTVGVFSPKKVERIINVEITWSIRNDIDLDSRITP